MSGRGRAALFGVALALNLGLLALAHRPEPKPLFGDEKRYWETALAVARGLEVEQDPLWPALPARMLGLVLRLGGESLLGVQLLQVGLWLAAAWLLGCIATGLLGSGRAALAALVLFLFSPELMAFSHYLWPEIPHLFCFLASLALVVRLPQRPLAVAAGGACFGGALLLKLVLLPFAPVMLLFVGLIPRRGVRAGAARAGLFAAALVAVLLPTLLSNLREQGRFVIADSTTFNLWVGLQDESPVDYEAAISGREHVRFQRAGPDFAARNRATREAIRAFASERGWPSILAGQLAKQPFRLLGHETFFTTQLPGGPRAGYAFRSPALARALRGWAYAWHALILGAGAFGLAFLAFGRPGWMHALAVLLALNAAVFLFLHAKTRYLLPLLPVFALFGGVAWRAWETRLRGSFEGLRFSRPRALAGGAWALLVVAAAFRAAW